MSTAYSIPSRALSDAILARWDGAFARLAASDVQAPVCPAEAHLAPLAALADGWDGEGAPAPAPAAIEAAREVLRDLAMHDHHPEADAIDADVMGGVAVYLYGPPGSDRSVWLAFGNDGANTVHCTGPCAPPGARLTPESMADALAFVAD